MLNVRVHKMLRRIRVVLAAVFFLGLTLLLLDVSGVVHSWTGWMAKAQLLPALLAGNFLIVALLLVLTLIFGRLYCSTICPLGVMQDLVARLSRRLNKRKKYSYSPALTWLRYAFLGLFVVLMFLGLGGIAALIAPYSTFGRITTHLLQPVWALCNNGVAALAESAGSYAVSETEIIFYGWLPLGIAVFTVVLICALAWRGGRTWCNTVCPVGTVLGFLSRFSFYKIRFDTDNCTKCGACSRACKASCIDVKLQAVDASRCVTCGNCLTKCKFDALHYIAPLAAKASSKQSPEEPADKGRRSFLITSGLLATAALAQEGKKLDGGLAAIEDKKEPSRQTPLTPPGSLSARNMQTHCTTCQLCVSECPNHVLRPSTKLDTLLQPTMSYEHGFCRPECVRCSEVCPTGAIRPLTRETKSSTQIGHAVWMKKNCLPARDGVTCGNCERHCPAGAITMIPLDPADEASPKVPAVNTAVCIGCGACEYVCPARPYPAIYVEGHEVHHEK